MPPAFLGEESQALGDGPDPRANLHKDGRPDKSVVHRHGQASGEAGANRDVDFGPAGHERVHESDGKMEDEGRGGSVGNADKDVVARLRLAKALSFSSGAGMVAWNKFSSLWLLSVGLTPTGLCSFCVCTLLLANIGVHRLVCDISHRFCVRERDVGNEPMSGNGVYQPELRRTSLGRGQCSLRMRHCQACLGLGWSSIITLWLGLDSGHAENPRVSTVGLMVSYGERQGRRRRGAWASCRASQGGTAAVRSQQSQTLRLGYRVFGVL